MSKDKDSENRITEMSKWWISCYWVSNRKCLKTQLIKSYFQHMTGSRTYILFWDSGRDCDAAHYKTLRCRRIAQTYVQTNQGRSQNVKNEEAVQGVWRTKSPSRVQGQRSGGGLKSEVPQKLKSFQNSLNWNSCFVIHITHAWSWHWRLPCSSVSGYRWSYFCLQSAGNNCQVQRKTQA